MPILIGVDEAGYGPNYGPLVVAATAWRVEERKRERGRRKAVGRKSTVATTTRQAVATPPTSTRPYDLYELLRDAVVRSPAETSQRLAIE